ncbi:MAG: helix-turn-helix transcriptional regulator [Desulfovibrio sp.]
METIARKLGFSPRWLLLGEGEPEVEAAPTAADQQAQPGQDDVAGRLLRKRSLGGVPLAGLASCGLREWGTPSPLAVRAARPADLNHPDAFAVMATGDSMVPAGIREGYLLYCDPGNPPDVGDAVYVELANKSATVKILEGLDSETLRLRGWLPPDGQGHQKHYFEETPARLVTRIATVVWVRRKL